MEKDNDALILSALNNGSQDFHPSIQVEHALSDIKDTYLTSPLAKIPFTEIAALGGAFSGIPAALAPEAQGLYRCVFPQGVVGTLAKANGGNIGAIFNNGRIVGQARWVPVDKMVGPAVFKATLIAVAVLAVVKQIDDIKAGQREIIGILERDKKSQLLVDYDILASYMDDYRYYWENDANVIVNLNQVKNIKRNAQKDIRSYSEQIEDMVSAKRNILKLESASRKIGMLLDRFVHYKLALNVYAIAEYMEVMLSKNFQSEYLDKVSSEIRDKAFDFRELYTKCYDKIEILKKEAITSQAASKLADVSKTVGSVIARVPVVKNGPVDEFLIDVGDTIKDTEQYKLKKTLDFFTQYKDNGITPVADHIDMINALSNKPTAMLYDNNIVYFSEYQEAM